MKTMNYEVMDEVYYLILFISEEKGSLFKEVGHEIFLKLISTSSNQSIQ